MNYFVVSDIHGMDCHFEEILNFWNRRNSKLIILGDMLDRGPNSLNVLKKVYELKSLYSEDVYIVLGNHEFYFWDFVKEPFTFGDNYWNVGGRETILSLLEKKHPNVSNESFLIISQLIEKEYPWIFDMFENLSTIYLEKGKVLFTHAGFQSIFSDFKNSKQSEFYTIRNHYKYPNQTGYINVFGHTPTRKIHRDNSDDIWVNQSKNYIAIDGACSMGGQLNALLINDLGEIIDYFSVA